MSLSLLSALHQTLSEMENQKNVSIFFCPQAITDEKREEKGYNDLIVAIKEKKSIARLLKNHPDQVNEKSNSGRNALWYAVNTGQIENTASILSTDKSDFCLDLEVTVFDLALVSDDPRLYEPVYEYAKKHDMLTHLFKSSTHATSIYVNLIVKSKWLAISFLLKKGFDLSVREDNGFDLLHLTALSNESTILYLLVEAYPHLIDEPRSDGYAPIHLAATNNHKESVRVLLQAGANPHLEILGNDTESDDHGKTPDQLCDSGKIRQLIEYYQKKIPSKSDDQVSAQ
jgi:hypothetical protein